MLKWLKGLAGGGGKTTGGKSAATTPSRDKLVESLDDLIKTPGKACYRTLTSLAGSATRDEFVNLVHCPAFVGSGIRDGQLERGEGGLNAPGKSQRTQAFSASEIAKLVEGASLEQSIFLLRKPVLGQGAELRRFSVGRTRENDILMNDFAISRSHAEVELRGEDYFLKDLGSSNGTFVNGELIDDRGLLLRDSDRVRFARYEFQFLSAGSLFDLLRKRAQRSSSTQG